MVSIVVCTYNGERYLREVLQAILNQKDFSIYVENVLVVDNASIDDTKKIVMEFCRKYPVVKYEYEPISGLTYARKHAAYMSSEWVAFLDDDNIVTENWLVQMMGFIKSNNLLGVCNSACIATPAVKFSEREMSILYAVAPGLACTHACMESYVHNDPPMISTPFGAGMFIRTRQLKRYLEEGWTTSIGRTKDNLASGEDGEIARAVLKQGFSYGYNNKAAILHIIPHRRIEDDYLVRLSEGLDEGYYRFLRSQKYALIKLMMVFSKNCLLIFLDPIIRLRKKSNYEKTRWAYSIRSRKNINRLIVGIKRKDDKRNE